MKRRRLQKSVCVICGEDEYVEQNHAGCRNHLPWFKVPFCKRHHDQFHTLLDSVRVNLRSTPDKLKRLVLAAMALTIALWMVLQALWEAVS